jgi:hypothetical protein
MSARILAFEAASAGKDERCPGGKKLRQNWYRLDVGHIHDRQPLPQAVSSNRWPGCGSRSSIVGGNADLALPHVPGVAHQSVPIIRLGIPSFASLDIELRD